MKAVSLQGQYMALDEFFKERERDILRLMADGLTNQEIGDRLILARETVRWYNKQIFSKLKVRNRTEAVTRAQELGLLDTDRPPRSSQLAEGPVKSPIQYTKSGDLYVAYQVIGDGPVDLLFVSGFVSHLEVGWEEPVMADFLTELAGFSRLILFDRPGVGLSDRTPGGTTLEETMDDMKAVLDAVGSQRAVIMGVSEGGAASILFASTCHERVLGLIVFGATPKLVREGPEPRWAVPRYAYDRAMNAIQKEWGGPYAIERFAPSRAHDRAFREWWARLLRTAASPSAAIACFDVQRDLDIRHILSSVRTRTLVLHPKGDRVVLRDAGRYIADQMPNAIWHELPGSDHFFWLHGDEMMQTIRQFVMAVESADPVQYTLATVLCVDIDGTDSEAFHRQAQQIITRFRGTCLNDTLHTMTATFDGPSRAIHCADSLRQVAAQMNVAFRAGLHTGECEVIGNHLRGVTLDLAAQIKDCAEDGEILVSQTIRDLVAGSGMVFIECGARKLRGLSAEWNVFAVV